jgi:hypothetical protein
MKFSIGDKIVLKRTGEEGIVLSYINKQILEVEVNGTSFPAYEDDIDHPYLKWFTEKKPQKKNSLPEQLPVEKPDAKLPRLTRGMYLSFVPVFKMHEMEELVDHLKVYLINESPYAIQLKYEVVLLQHTFFSHQGKLHEFGNLYLHNMPYAEMNDQPRFNWQMTDTANPKHDTLSGTLKIKPAKLFSHISDVLTKGEASFSYLLADDFKLKIVPEKQEKYYPPAKPEFITLGQNGKKMEAAKAVLDLHIEELLPDHKGLTNADIIKIQLDTFEKYLHLAIAQHQERMVVIHGLGKGKLKDEVHRILKRTPEVRLFTNQWHGSYGFGATEIYFKY